MYNDLMYEHDSIALNERHLALRNIIATLSNEWANASTPKESVLAFVELEKAQRELHYFFYVMDVLLEHYCCVSCVEDAYQIIEEESFLLIEKWLTKIGYDLKGEFELCLKN